MDHKLAFSIRHVHDAGLNQLKFLRVFADMFMIHSFDRLIGTILHLKNYGICKI